MFRVHHKPGWRCYPQVAPGDSRVSVHVGHSSEAVSQPAGRVSYTDGLQLNGQTFPWVTVIPSVLGAKWTAVWEWVPSHVVHTHNICTLLPWNQEADLSFITESKRRGLSESGRANSHSTFMHLHTSEHIRRATGYCSNVSLMSIAQVLWILTPDQNHNAVTSKYVRKRGRGRRNKARSPFWSGCSCL